MTTKLAISTTPVDVDGTKIEPEQQPALQIQTWEIPVDLGVANPDGPPTITGHLGKQEATVKKETTAGDLARSFISVCEACKHFSLDRARAIKQITENQVTLKKMLIQTEWAKTDADAELVMQRMGHCKANSVLVHPLATCDSFRPARDSDNTMARARNAKYDEIMQTAAGKKV